MQASEEQALLDEICRIVCEEAGYRMVWVGYAVNDDARSIRPMAWAGAEQGYLAEARFTWADTEEHGRGPAGLAIRAGVSACIQDFASEPNAALWGGSALQRGYRSCIALPLKEKKGAPFGALCIYSAEPGTFTVEETKILNELAGSLAFRISVLQSRSARIQADQDVALVTFALNNVREAAFLIDEHASFVYVNEEACRTLGYNRDELLARGVADVDPDFLAERWRDSWRERATRYAVSIESRHETKDGRILPVKISASYIEYGEKSYCLSLVRDLSEHKQLERELTSLEREYRTLLETVPDLIVRYDPDLRRIYVNPAWEKSSGLSAAEVINIPYTDTPRVPRPFDEEYVKKLRQVLQTGIPQIAEFTWDNANGEKLLLEYVIVPEYDHHGRIASVLAIGRDITERRKLEEQLRQHQRMEAIGQLAGGVAHDFNNMLLVILCYTDLALSDISPTEPLYAQLQEIKKAAERSADLTRQLLAFARKQTIVTKVLNLNDTLSGMLHMLQRLIGEDIEMSWIPGEDLWSVKVDPSQIDQVLANLCVNARDAINGIGKVTIETRNISFDGASFSSYNGFVPGDYILLAVSDDGCGMNEETLSQIFEPFFTTKGLTTGTGLGLSTVYGIVKQHDGFLDVNSMPGQGTTFKIYIPRHNADVAGSMRDSATEVSLQGSETVLIVDDEEVILNLCKTMLEKLGYKPLIARTPGDAIPLFEKYADDIQLLLTDVVLPQMNGRELVERLTSVKPGLKCLYMSGYTSDIIAQRGILEEGVHFIQKPMTMKDMAIGVRKVLDHVNYGA